MKLAFLLLLLANLLLLAIHNGVFGALPESGREPERVARQIEPERIRALTPAEVQQIKDKTRELPAAGASAAPAINPLQLAEVATGQGCAEFGDFTGELPNKVRTRLEALAPIERLSARAVDAAGWYMVYVPPFKTRAEVDAAAADLRQKGVKELLVIADNSPLRFGIALGSFKDPELANRHLADLQRRGVNAARVADRPSTVPGTRFMVRGIDSTLAEKLSALQKEFPSYKLMPCNDTVAAR